jgi:nucleoside-diphosphate-sugar epimerase
MSKKLLILGGTQMVGRDFVELLSDNINYKLSIANRGITNKNLFTHLEHITIDRNNPDTCKELSGRFFDIVIDFSCYNVNQLNNILKFISYDYYILISTQSVLDTHAIQTKTHWLHKYAKDKKTLEEYIVYNKLKNTNIVRPCALYGKHDYTNRFYEHDNKFYSKQSGNEIVSNKYNINVREFSQYLLEYMQHSNLTNIKILHIDGAGITYYDH